MAHRHLLGKADSGQNTLATEWALHDIKNNHAICYFDFAGTDTATIISRIPKSRTHQVIDFAPAQYAIPYNPLITDTPTLTADTLATAIKYGFGFADTPTARMSGLLYNLLMALISARQGLFGMFLMLDSDSYREHVLRAVSDPVVLRYWHWYGSLPDKQQYEERSSTYNKVQMLMADPRIRDISGTRSAFDLKDIVTDKILFIRLPQGEFGVEKVQLLSNLWLTQIHQAAMSRDRTVPLSIYINDFYRLAPATLKDILATGSEYNLSLTLSNQYLDQVDRSLMDSISANTDQYIFRVSKEDADRLPAVKPQDFLLFETHPSEYVRFHDGSYSRGTVGPLTHLPVPASAGKIHDRMRFNLHSPATKEIAELLKKHS
jgi:hypothetical protein